MNNIPIQPTLIEFNRSEPTLTSDALNTLGNKAYLASNLAKAEALYLAAIETDPLNPEPWGNLGLIWHTIGSLDDALKCYMKALEMNPRQARTWCNVALMHEEMGYVDHAERMFKYALELEPMNPRLIGNLAQLYFKRFDFARGWNMMECRFTTVPAITIPRKYPFPLWNGLPTKKLFVWGEQGVGDEIIYGSLLPRLTGLGQPFICELDERLVPIFQRSMPEHEFVPKGSDRWKGCTAHVPMMSLGFHFVRSEADLDRQSPFLYPSESRIVVFNSKSIAISWRSFHADINRRMMDRKSAKLADFRVLGERDDLDLVSVQYGDVGAEIGEWGLKPIIQPGLDIDLYNDIDGVMSIIAACDAVVTTSNVTAHFSGAMGKETYLISKGEPPLFYWRTPTGRSLWYPSVNVIVAPTFEEAVAKVSALLAE